ncbi:carboxymuconolactone decarboxylase family protein [Sphingomonas sp. AOB5]|uniref:carboxymuconolactone decarboxylase family protein n=1 Tax=Sphingomonas sp. AOB5 TaxID=3034017 RepID=UPI0023F7985B|nr:carboxymuconolactone decarboxylase family protein [Sphingomonas sp. AOB5]MDF7775619.1 carboxymuconolactone decarboxylase family protein [Sphingomonas sp. AOB5]
MAADSLPPTGAIPRLDFWDLEPRLAEALRPRVERLGYLGEFFRCAGHQPDALRAFVDFTEAAKAGLPKKLVEVIALTAAGWMGNDYERNQHERFAVRQGFARTWVADVNRLDPDAAFLLSEEERLVQRFTLSALESKGKAAGPLLAELSAALGHYQAIAVLMILGRYVVHAIFVNTLELAPPVPSIFEDGFTG